MTRACLFAIDRTGPSRPLPVLAARLQTEVVDLTATHTLTQLFCNPVVVGGDAPNSAVAEARYTFPLYESCAVTSFTAQIGSTIIRGVVKPKEEAKVIYAAATAAGKQAALLEQNTAEVFTTSLGNIPLGCFVTVVIKYVHELKQDTGAEAVRLVIPTVIAPKYGWASPDSALYEPGWAHNWNAMTAPLVAACGGPIESPGLAIEVFVTMSGKVSGLTSPSHPIDVVRDTQIAGGDYDYQRARAILTGTSLSSLEKDFTLLITTADVATPSAFIAPHPTLQDTSTLMVTLVPKFALPQQQTEVVFIVDRSGSMYDKIGTVRSALHLFLASLPLGTHFNIGSFGSKHSFLWRSSQPYTEETLREAKKHVNSMSANMGGTEMYPPIEAAVSARRDSGTTEVLVLTDGEIWHTEVLFKYIEGVAKDGKVRFFSLGVGRSVSHLLVEGIGRAGRGYSQLVGDGENMQKKTMRMLKAALTPHVNDWSVSWEGKSASLTTPPAPVPAAPVAPLEAISLFDPDATPDAPPPPAPIPEAAHPPILQTPSTIPPLFPYTRTTVFYLLTTPAAAATVPETITLTGTALITPAPQPLTLTIKITPITSEAAATGLYTLAGRRLLSDLEEGRCTYLPADPVPAPEAIEAEGKRLGVQFGLASKWTSFVAVADSGDTVAEPEPEPKSARNLESVLNMRGGSATRAPPLQSSVCQLSDLNVVPFEFSRAVLAPAAMFGSAVPTYVSHSGGGGVLGKFPSRNPRPPPVTDLLAGGSLPISTLPGMVSQRAASMSSGRLFEDSIEAQGGGPVHLMPRKKKKLSKNSNPNSNSGSLNSFFFASKEKHTDYFNEEEFIDYSDNESLDEPAVAGAAGAGAGAGSKIRSEDIIAQLSRLQLFSGHFPLSAQLLQLLGYSPEKVTEAIQRLGLTGEEGKTAFATALVLAHLKVRLAEFEEEWELMAGKAGGCLEGVEKADIEREAGVLVGGGV